VFLTFLTNLLWKNISFASNLKLQFSNLHLYVKKQQSGVSNTGLKCTGKFHLEKT